VARDNEYDPKSRVRLWGLLGDPASTVGSELATLGVPCTPQSLYFKSTMLAASYAADAFGRRALTGFGVAGIVYYTMGLEDIARVRRSRFPGFIREERAAGGKGWGVFARWSPSLQRGVEAAARLLS